MLKCLIFLSLVGVVKINGQPFQSIDEGSSSVSFKIRNMGSTVGGTFSKVKGRIRFNSDSLTTSDFIISIASNTIDTGIVLRDKHLRKEDYFNVNKYPELTFLSSKVTRSPGDRTFIMTGKLKIKDVSKEIVFPFTIEKVGNQNVFTAKFNLNRNDYKVGGGSFFMADEVEVNVKVRTMQIIQ